MFRVKKLSEWKIVLQHLFSQKFSRCQITHTKPEEKLSVKYLFFACLIRGMKAGKILEG